MNPDWLKDVRILLVDDNQYMIRILQVLVQAFGARNIMAATDAVQALEALKSRSVDLILLDQMMPVLTGTEFTKLLRRSSDSPNQFVPIIMVTAHTEQRVINEARDSGVNAVLRKPISARELCVRIRTVVCEDRPFIRSGDYIGPLRPGIDPEPDEEDVFGTFG